MSYRPRTLQVLAMLTTILLSSSIQAEGLGDVIVDLGRGPVTVHVPDSYDPGTPAPLVMLLHGYGSSGEGQEAYMQFLPIADEFGFIFIAPDGLRDFLGLRFWNATDACCDFFGNTDDSGYLKALIDESKLLLNVDEKRVFVTGHSNGGYMSYRMACDHSETVAAIASLAGATWLDPADCAPVEPVHVLQMHGTQDETVLFDGGCFLGNVGCYPSAIKSIQQWAIFGGCDNAPEREPTRLDLDLAVPGDETRVGKYATNCDARGSAEIWAIAGGGHVPFLTGEYSRLVIEHLFEHPKP